MFDKIKDKINKNGSLDLADFMHEVLANKENGYYGGKSTKIPIGKDGDFITAPEISQLFGEIIGVWAANSWNDLCTHHEKICNFNLVELGPGKGTLMQDLLRATRNVPNFHNKMNVFMVEISDELKRKQKKALEDFTNVKWIDSVDEIPNQPTIFIANEFFDALPINQFIKIKKRWYSVSVTLKEKSSALEFDHIAISDRLNDELNRQHVNAYDGAIVEFSDLSQKIYCKICSILKNNSGFGLFIDYGYNYENLKSRTHYNSTLQAVKNHKFHPILENLGEADLTSHVDFKMLENIAKEQNLEHFFTTQKTFLEQYGINIRAENLMKIASRVEQENIMLSLNRLCSKKQMGELFKALIISHG